MRSSRCSSSDFEEFESISESGVVESCSSLLELGAVVEYEELGARLDDNFVVEVVNVVELGLDPCADELILLELELGFTCSRLKQLKGRRSPENKSRRVTSIIKVPFQHI